MVVKGRLEGPPQELQSVAMQRINKNLMEHGFYVGGDCHLFFLKADEDTDETVDYIGILHKNIVQGNTFGLSCAVKHHSKFGWLLGV